MKMFRGTLFLRYNRAWSEIPGASSGSLQLLAVPAVRSMNTGRRVEIEANMMPARYGRPMPGCRLPSFAECYFLTARRHFRSGIRCAWIALAAIRASASSAADLEIAFARGLFWNSAEALDGRDDLVFCGTHYGMATFSVSDPLAPVAVSHMYLCGGALWMRALWRSLWP